METEPNSKIDNNNNSQPSALFENSIDSEKKKDLESMLLNIENISNNNSQNNVNLSAENISIHDDEKMEINNITNLNKILENSLDISFHENEIIPQENEDANSSKKIK